MRRLDEKRGAVRVEDVYARQLRNVPNIKLAVCRVLPGGAAVVIILAVIRNSNQPSQR